MRKRLSYRLKLRGGQSSQLTATESGRESPWNDQPLTSTGLDWLPLLALYFFWNGSQSYVPQQMKSFWVLGLQKQSSIVISYHGREGLGFIFPEKNLSKCPTKTHVSSFLHNHLEQAGMEKPRNWHFHKQRCLNRKESPNI